MLICSRDPYPRRVNKVYISWLNLSCCPSLFRPVLAAVVRRLPPAAAAVAQRRLTREDRERRLPALQQLPRLLLLTPIILESYLSHP